VRTDFTAEQLADPDTAQSDKILRNCTHCGFCTATCPTYLLLGDELDSPRGRIYLIKDMLARPEPPAAETVKHIDRCLSCLACMTTCPSGVNYMHLVDHARRRIEEHYRRPWSEQIVRRLLGTVLPRPGLFRVALRAARLVRPFTRLLPQRLAPMLAQAPPSLPHRSSADRAGVFPAEGARRMRVALLTGCAQRVLAPAINAATIRLLTRLGCEVVVARGSGCCGALNHHLGQEAAALAYARADIEAWERERLACGLDAVAINTSGCGTTVKDYGFMLREDAAYAEKAARIAGLARDVTEIVADLGLSGPSPDAGGGGLRVAYHSACSMQHGQRLHAGPTALLTNAGFAVVDVPESHVCCGSAGTYNLLQPEIAARLRERKLANIAKTGCDMIATGNIGCMVQLAAPNSPPVAHTVELLDWATGGPAPEALADRYPTRRPIAAISNDRPSAAAPITVGASQPASPTASRSPAAPRSTQATVIGS
jgi:glycolate oxidase iron-sulfur subunit